MRKPPDTLVHWLHRLSAALALLILSTFWLASFVSELFFDAGTVAATKRAIVLGLVALVPCMAALHVTGERITGERSGPLVARKRRLLRFMGANAALVLVPSALALWLLSRGGVLGPAFFAVQVLELLAGGLNVTLLVVNIRAGLGLAGRLRRRPCAAPSPG